MSASLDRDLAAAIERGAESVARRYGKRTPVTFSKGRGTVEAVNADGTLDVSYQGAVLQSVLSTTACANVEVGDSVLVEFFDARAYATGVIATENIHYVNPQPMEFKIADTGSPADRISVYGMVYGTEEGGYFALLNVTFVNNDAYTLGAWGETVIATAVGWRTVVDEAMAVAVENIASNLVGRQFFDFHGSTISYRSCVQTVITAGAWHKACIVAPVEPVQPTTR